DLATRTRHGRCDRTPARLLARAAGWRTGADRSADRPAAARSRLVAWGHRPVPPAGRAGPATARAVQARECYDASAAARDVPRAAEPLLPAAGRRHGHTDGGPHARGARATDRLLREHACDPQQHRARRFVPRPPCARPPDDTGRVRSSGRSVRAVGRGTPTATQSLIFAAVPGDVHSPEQRARSVVATG